MAVILDKISSKLARFTSMVVILLCVYLVGSLLVSVFFRYVVGHALSWPEEISLILFTWLVLLAGSIGVREEFHVRLTLITSRFPAPLQLALERAVTASIGIFGIILAYSGKDLVNRTAEHLTPTLRLPLDWLNYSAAACGILIFVHAVAALMRPRQGDSD